MHSVLTLHIHINVPKITDIDMLLKASMGDKSLGLAYECDFVKTQHTPSFVVGWKQ